MNEISTNRVIVVGDVHGDLNQLLYPLFDLWSNYSNTDYLIYLGDYIDRGEGSCYIYEIIRWLIVDVRDPKIVFLRGNHEDAPVSAAADYIGNMNGYLKPSLFLAGFKILNLPYHFEIGDIIFDHIDVFNTLNNMTSYIKSGGNPEVVMRDPFYGFVVGIDANKYRLCIHGHDHRPTDPSFIDKIFQERQKENRLCASISIDNDASYGIGLAINYCDLSLKKCKRPRSKVYYLVFNRESNECALGGARIEYGSKGDLNVLSFNNITVMIQKHLNRVIAQDRGLTQRLNTIKLNLNSSYNILLEFSKYVINPDVRGQSDPIRFEIYTMNEYERNKTELIAKMLSYVRLNDEQGLLLDHIEDTTRRSAILNVTKTMRDVNSVYNYLRMPVIHSPHIGELMTVCENFNVCWFLNDIPWEIYFSMNTHGGVLKNIFSVEITEVLKASLRNKYIPTGQLYWLWIRNDVAKCNALYGTRYSTASRGMNRMFGGAHEVKSIIWLILMMLCAAMVIIIIIVLIVRNYDKLINMNMPILT